MFCNIIAYPGESVVTAIDDIIFENTDPPITLVKGTVYNIEAVKENGVNLFTDAVERFMIDLDTFEKGFEAV